jgi:tRNA threonylcarbamoyladenosine biosynthesis protein TsaE
VNKLTLQLISLAELLDAADLLLKCFPGSRVFAFEGELGAGKTTFIKALCAQLGVTETTSSPSFSLVNEYPTQDGKSVYHFDLYRMQSSKEAVDVGMEEYLWSGNYCMIEWSDRAKELLPDTTVWIKLEVDGEIRQLIAE